MKIILTFGTNTPTKNAGVAELVHALVLGTSEETHKGSTPFSCTNDKNGRHDSLGNLVSVVLAFVKKLVNTGEKLARECLQQCVQYVSNDANTKTKKVIAMRSILTTGSLRKKLQSIHWCNFNYNCCYSSLTISNINSIHLWLVLHTTANIQRIVFAILSTGVSKCSTYVHR